jgi:hypothetical protein
METLKEIISVGAVVVGYIVLMVWILPRLGVQT